MQKLLSAGLKKLALTGLLLTYAAGLTAYGRPIEGITFSHKDWEIACDNTGTCRAAGYTAEDKESDFGLSVLLTRTAGPNQPVQGQLSLAVWDEEDLEHRNLRLQIGNQNYGRINDGVGLIPLSSQQVQALLNVARTDQVIAFVDTNSGEKGILSGQGMSAVLLKMDEFQGRVGTTGALLRRGNQTEANVLDPQAIPVLVIPQVLPENSQEYSELKQHYLNQEQKLIALTQITYDEECFANEDQQKLEIYPLNNEKALLSRYCWMGAYNEGIAYWLIDRDLKTAQLITNAGSEYEKGQIWARQKGRGLGDCWWGEDYAWDGAQFIKTSAFQTGLCKGQPGGFWTLPTVVYEVKNDANEETNKRP